VSISQPKKKAPKSMAAFAVDAEPMKGSQTVISYATLCPPKYRFRITIKSNILKERITFQRKKDITFHCFH
jgi:hypothetical protein